MTGHLSSQIRKVALRCLWGWVSASCEAALKALLAILAIQAVQLDFSVQPELFSEYVREAFDSDHGAGSGLPCSGAATANAGDHHSGDFHARGPYRQHAGNDEVEPRQQQGVLHPARRTERKRAALLH